MLRDRGAVRNVNPHASLSKPWTLPNTLFIIAGPLEIEVDYSVSWPIQGFFFLKHLAYLPKLPTTKTLLQLHRKRSIMLWLLPVDELSCEGPACISVGFHFVCLDPCFGKGIHVKSVAAKIIVWQQDVYRNTK